MPTDGPARRYAGASEEERRSDRRQRLLQATLDAVGEGGVVTLTVGAVSTRAGVAKRYFYESFRSLDELLSAALEQVFEQVREAIASVALRTDATPTELVEAAVGGAIAAMDDPRVARLYLESAGNAALLATRDRAVDGFVDQLLQQLSGGSPIQPVDRVTGHLLVSGSTHVVALWLRGRLDLSRDELVAHMVTVGVRAAATIGDARPEGE